MNEQERRRISPKLIAGVAFQLVLAGPAWSAPGDAGLGEYLSSECVTCHQLSGTAIAGVPSITGMAPDAFVAALMAYKTGIRDNQVMHSIAARLSDEEMAALAAYFAARRTP